MDVKVEIEYLIHINKKCFIIDTIKHSESNKSKRGISRCMNIKSDANVLLILKNLKNF